MYNGLQWGMIKRISKGLEFQSAYTWSKYTDNIASSTNSENSNAQTSWFVDPFHPSLDKGLSAFDVTQVWKFNLLYHLPKLTQSEGAAGKLLNGWWISTITTIQSGSPFTLGLGTNRSNSAVGAGAAGVDRPDVVPGRSIASMTSGTSTCTSGPQAGKTLGTPVLYFDPCAFTNPIAGLLGTVGRNTLRGPGYRGVDFSLVKDTAISHLGEAGNIQFRAELFNILNHANFGLPNRTVFSGASIPATAGQITTTVGTSRQIQLALKIIF